MARVITQFFSLMQRRLWKPAIHLCTPFFKRSTLPVGTDEGEDECCNDTIKILYSCSLLYVPSHCGHFTSKIIQKVLIKTIIILSQLYLHHFFGWLLIINNILFYFILSFHLELYSGIKGKLLKRDPV